MPEFVTFPAPPELVKLPELPTAATVPAFDAVPALVVVPVTSPSALFVKLAPAAMSTEASVPEFVRLPPSMSDRPVTEPPVSTVVVAPAPVWAMLA